ncbi:MAG: hypothetical protein QXO02_10260 [Thermofilaceae archaeon]
MDSVIAEYREFTRQLLQELAKMQGNELDDFINLNLALIELNLHTVMESENDVEAAQALREAGKTLAWLFLVLKRRGANDLAARALDEISSLIARAVIVRIANR